MMEKLCCVRFDKAAIVIGSLYASIFLSGCILIVMQFYQHPSVTGLDLTFFITMWCWGSTAGASSLLLIIGSLKRNPSFILPWLIVGIVTFSILTSLFIRLLYVAVILDRGYWSWELLVLVLNALHLYFLIGMLKFYKNLKRSRKLVGIGGPELETLNDQTIMMRDL